MISPARINDISLDIADVYAHITDELLVNIGKHITSPNWTHTAAWEIQKLAELGQLTKENAAIINKWIKAIPPELRNAMEETRKAALGDIEKQMEAAAKAGYVTPAITDRSVAVFQDMQNQAADRLNLVNTTMLQSSVEQYQRAVLLTQQEYDRLMAQKEATQQALNEGAASVATGVETRRVAVRRAIGRIAAEGLTGFVDRAGRHWSPEAYVNMDVRTTVHNTAIEATRARMGDFGTQVFQVSSHAGARPLCYPYQGKFYSWDNTSGMIELGDGSYVAYEPLNSTTYGQPAGLFGINCGHYPIPIVAGITIPHGADNIQPEEENAKAYAESQEQRALERKIREAKRVVEMAGDSATPEDKAKIKDAQAEMRKFIERTGRTRRYDREQIGGTPNVKPVEPQKPENENVNAQLTIPEIKPVTVDIGDKLRDSLGTDNAEEYRKLIEAADPRVAATYNAYADDLATVTQKAGAGTYYPSTHNLDWDYRTNGEKYHVIAHEYGHHVDNMIPTEYYTTTEVDKLNEMVKLPWNSSRKVFDVGPSSSDEFLSAMRADRQNLSVYRTNTEENQRIRNDLLGDHRNLTTGIQDAFDGFWGTQDNYNPQIHLPWGHGDKYYNSDYNKRIKAFGLDKDLQAAYKALGFDASNQAKVKKLTRDYTTASELWANIQAAETVGGDERRLMRQYFPTAVAAWENITGGLLNG